MKFSGRSTARRVDQALSAAAHSAPRSAPGILVLRPMPEARTTLQQIEQMGYVPVHFATTDIVATDRLTGAEIESRLKAADWLVFVSGNAVRYLLEFVSSKQLAGKRIASVGAQTAARLQNAGITVNCQPNSDFSSEGLLAEPELAAPAGQNILIIRGDSGRELLAESLRQRDAKVAYLEIYRRVPARADGRLLQQQWPQVDVILATSMHLLDNLADIALPIIGPRLWQKPVSVISPRLAEHARRMGFGEVWQATESSIPAMLQSIAAHFAENRNKTADSG